MFEFLDLRKNHGIEEQRARDLFYGMWTPDLFMKVSYLCISYRENSSRFASAWF